MSHVPDSLDRMKVRATSAVQEFACHSKACAPPPAGTGGSAPTTAGPAGGLLARKRRDNAERGVLVQHGSEGQVAAYDRVRNRILNNVGPASHMASDRLKVEARAHHLGMLAAKAKGFKGAPAKTDSQSHHGQEPKSFFNPGGKSEYWTRADSHLQAKIHHEQQTKHNATSPDAKARQRRTEKPVKINGSWYVKTTQWPLGG